jgi:hypothetical protein
LTLKHAPLEKTIAQREKQILRSAEENRSAQDDNPHFEFNGLRTKIE